ncbi:unnamed protein product [Amoebophrya sp. A120]|nr:unnamed protein product [Amoebophrya sp. A120]|eukprot:GSA120T00022294001.1
MASSSTSPPPPDSMNTAKLVEDLEKTILQKFKLKYNSQPETGIIRHLKYYDLTNTGKLDWKSFQKSMEQYAIGAPLDVLQLLFNRYANATKNPLQSNTGSLLLEIRSFAKFIVDGTVRTYYASLAETQESAANGAAIREEVNPRSTAGSSSQRSSTAPRPPHSPTAPSTKTVPGFLRALRENLFPRGPGKVLELVNLFMQYDEKNYRVLPIELLMSILDQKLNLVDGAGDLDPLAYNKIDGRTMALVLPTWADPYDRNLILYDDFLAELKIPLNHERRQAVRAAYRKLDPDQEGFVNLSDLERAYNVSRHPYAVMGAQVPDSLYNEFLDSLMHFLQYRRGVLDISKTAAGERIPWEEFEAYYEMLNGCYPEDTTFLCILTRCWDVDKPSVGGTGVDRTSATSSATAALGGGGQAGGPPGAVLDFNGYGEQSAGQQVTGKINKQSQQQQQMLEDEYYRRDAMPAAGQKGKERVGLHHWQANTLAESHTYRNVGEVADLKGIFREACEYLSRKGGVRMAMEVVRNYVLADDNLDDYLDRAEFRKASRDSGLRFTQDEESDIFDLLGEVTTKRPVKNPSSDPQPERLLPLFSFLRAFFDGGLNAARYDIVHAAWALVAGGDSAVIPPQNLRQHLSFSTHPEVLQAPSAEARDRLTQQLTTEFLDTFSLYVNVTGRLSEEGNLNFATFLGYFEIYSAMITSDAYFDVVIRRMWGLSSDKDIEEIDGLPPVLPQAPTSQKVSRSSKSNVNEDTSNLEYAGLGYGANLANVSDGRGSNKDAKQYPNPTSPIYESSHVRAALFQEPVKLNSADDYFHHLCRRIRGILSKRGLKGWVAFIQGLQDKDDRGFGTIHRSQWTRLHKSLGLGLTIEESDVLFRALISPKDGGMDYRLLLNQIRMKSDKIAAPILQSAKSQFVTLLTAAGDNSASGMECIEINTLLRLGFNPEAYPLTVLRGQSLTASVDDFACAVAFLSAYEASTDSSVLGIETFLDLVDLGLGCYSTPDEARLFAQALGMDVKHLV